jgi:hypothetical protein
MMEDRVMGVSVFVNDIALGAPESPWLDPLGVPLNGSVSDILIKSGATPSLNPESGVSIMQAMINVIHGPLRISYNIINGRIFNESIYLL